MTTEPVTPLPPEPDDGTVLPEPPDGTRLEFEYGTDLYAIHRDDESSRRAGYPIGDGGETWCAYGSDLPKTWAAMLAEFGEDALSLAVRLAPVADDLPNRDRWPTEVYYWANRERIEAELAADAAAVEAGDR